MATTNYGWTTPTVNGSDNTWGTTLNTTLQSIDTQMKVAMDALAAAALLTAIKTVDGTGSGLDADLLDGIESNKFLRHGGSYTSGIITVSTGAPSGGSDGDIWLKV
jgi:hypothetical protein